MIQTNLYKQYILIKYINKIVIILTAIVLPYLEN